MDHEKSFVDKSLGQLMLTGTELYTAYLEDNRNTDQSWIEVVVMSFHDDNQITDKLKFLPGKPNIRQATWVQLHKSVSPALGQLPMVYAVCDYYAKLAPVASGGESAQISFVNN